MNSWPSIFESPLGFWRRPIQWCISSGVSVLQWITRLAVIITNEFGLREKNLMSTALYSHYHKYYVPNEYINCMQYGQYKKIGHTLYLVS